MKDSATEGCIRPSALQHNPQRLTSVASLKAKP